MLEKQCNLKLTKSFVLKPKYQAQNADNTAGCTAVVQRDDFQQIHINLQNGKMIVQRFPVFRLMLGTCMCISKKS